MPINGTAVAKQEELKMRRDVHIHDWKGEDGPENPLVLLLKIKAS